MMDPPDPPGHPFYLQGDWEVAAHIQIEVLRPRGEMTRSSANIFFVVLLSAAAIRMSSRIARDILITARVGQCSYWCPDPGDCWVKYTLQSSELEIR